MLFPIDSHYRKHSPHLRNVKKNEFKWLFATYSIINIFDSQVALRQTKGLKSRNFSFYFIKIKINFNQIKSNQYRFVFHFNFLSLRAKIFKKFSIYQMSNAEMLRTKVGPTQILNLISSQLQNDRATLCHVAIRPEPTSAYPNLIPHTLTKHPSPPPRETPHLNHPSPEPPILPLEHPPATEPFAP